MTKFLNPFKSSRLDVKNYFYLHDLTLTQKAEVYKIINVLRRYMIVDRDILNARVGEEIGLSYINKAIERNMVVQLRDPKAPANDCYYVMGLGGVSFVENDRDEINSFKLKHSFKEMKKILLANYHSVKVDYKLLFSKFNDLIEFNYFHFQDSKKRDIFLYFEDEVSPNVIIAKLKKYFISTLSEEDLPHGEALFSKYISKFSFEPIELRKTTFSPNSKSTLRIKE